MRRSCKCILSAGNIGALRKLLQVGNVRTLLFPAAVNFNNSLRKLFYGYYAYTHVASDDFKQRSRALCLRVCCTHTNNRRQVYTQLEAESSNNDLLSKAYGIINDMLEGVTSMSMDYSGQGCVAFSRLS